jgi:hypothetical protein
MIPFLPSCVGSRRAPHAHTRVKMRVRHDIDARRGVEAEPKTYRKHSTMNKLERLTGMTKDERRHVINDLVNGVQGRVNFGPIEAWKCDEVVYIQGPVGEINGIMTDDPEWLRDLLENKAERYEGLQ